AVGFTVEQQREGLLYNYRREPPMQIRPRGAGDEDSDVFAAMSGTDEATYSRERPGVSSFVLEDGAVYPSYSAYARGVDGLWGMEQWLDGAPRGRNERGAWWRRHDEYDKSS